MIGNLSRGWLKLPGDTFQPDTSAGPTLTRIALEALVVDVDDRLTFMCAPWGSGERIGIDHDLDGVLDGDETWQALMFDPYERTRIHS